MSKASATSSCGANPRIQRELWRSDPAASENISLREQIEKTGFRKNRKKLALKSWNGCNKSATTPDTPSTQLS